MNDEERESIELIPKLINALKEATADRNCDHTGNCKGCHIKQTQCFSYANFLVKKYESIALKNAIKNDDLQADRDQWKAQAEAFGRAQPYENWDEDDGNVLWWKFPIEEPPYVGTPLDANWPGYHTHWTKILIPSDETEFFTKGG